MTRATDIPATLTAGDTWSWSRELSDYLSTDGYSLSYAFVGCGSLSWDSGWVTSESDGSFTVTIPGSATTALDPGGTVRVTEMVTKDGARTTIRTVSRHVAPDPALGTSLEDLSSARRQLALINAFLEGNLEDGVQYQIIGSRQLQHWPLKDLIDYRDRLRREIAAEDAAANTERGALGRVYSYRYTGA